MGHSRGSSRFPRIAGARRRVSWVFGPSGIINSISTSTNNLFSLATQLVADDLTWVRTRGELLLQLLGGDGAGEGYQWAFGICLVTENAAGIGVTAVPAPFDDIGWDGWLVHQEGSLIQASSTFENNSNTLGGTVRVDIDSKAMRKTHATDVMVALLQVTEIGAGSTMQAHLRSRALVKLP